MIDGYWLPINHCDPRAVRLFLAHYSSAKGKRNGRLLREHGIVGPGEKLVPLTVACDALFAWRVERARQDGQMGVNCTVFRNEGTLLSSDLIAEASVLAWARWPGVRLFTFVDPRKVRSTNPGFCFLKAGWRRCGTSGRGLLIFERLPAAEAVAA